MFFRNSTVFCRRDKKCFVPAGLPQQNDKLLFGGQCPQTMAHQAGVKSGTPGQRPVTFLRRKNDALSNHGVQKRTERGAPRSESES